jgi:catechol 2,3-dioxygenase-like lactoylglutathione lyase family enzyme
MSKNSNQERAVDLLVNIDVDDLPKAIDFYRKAVGLRVGRRLGSLGVEMLGTRSAIYLLAKPEGTRPSTNADELRRYRRHWTPVHLDFVVAGLEAAVSQAIAAGATMRARSIRTNGAASPIWPILSVTEFVSSNSSAAATTKSPMSNKHAEVFSGA